MASPRALDASQINRIILIIDDIRTGLAKEYQLSLDDTQKLAEKFSVVTMIVNQAIRRITVPQHDAPGISNDTHGLDSRRNPEHLS